MARSFRSSRKAALPMPPEEYDAKDQRETRRILQDALDRPGGLTSVDETNIVLSDTTTNDVSSTQHGLAPKSPGDATKFLNGAADPDYAHVKDSDLATTDVTDNNATTGKHGFVKKLSGTATEYLDGSGNFSTPPIPTRFPAFPTFPSISGLEFRISAELSTITHVDGLVTQVNDLSGNARHATNGSTNGKPRYMQYLFSRQFPGLWFDGTNNQHLVATMPNLAKPFSVVMVMEEIAIGTGDGNLYRDQSARAVGYHNNGNSWSIHGGTNNFSSTALWDQNKLRLPLNGPSGLPCVRIDVYNGASSLICNNASEVSGNADGTGTQLGGTFNIGNGATAVSSAAKFVLYEMLVFSVALTTQNRDDLRAYYRDAVGIKI